MQNYFINLATGVVLGFVFVKSGFANFGEVHHFFVLMEPQMWLTVISAILITAIVFTFLQRGKALQTDSHDRKSATKGAIMIGVAWAITGVDPITVLAQLGSGYLPALVVLAGIALGARLHSTITHSPDRALTEPASPIEIEDNKYI